MENPKTPTFWEERKTARIRASEEYNCHIM